MVGKEHGLFTQLSRLVVRINGETIDARQFGKEVVRVFPKVTRGKRKTSQLVARKWFYLGLSHVPQ
jgi:hypothetical protein